MDRQQRAAAVGTENVIQIWDSMNDGSPYLAVFYNRNNKYFQYNKDDLNGARQFLSDNLNAIESQGDNSMYYLNIYPEYQKVYSNAPGSMICSFPFRLNSFEKEDSISGIPGMGAGPFAKMLQDQNNKVVELVKEIEKLKLENQPLNVWDRLQNVLETPGAAQTLIPLLSPVIGQITGLLSKITGAPMVPVNMPVPGISGPAEQPAIDKDLRLDAALDRIEKHIDLVEFAEAIANFADKNPALFQTYFNMLKSQG